jgi:hypothetical protein
MDPAAISDQIDRILRSQSFASKSQLRKLLEVLSKNIDSQNTLNPDLVIKELWPAEIRTKRAADVATEMNRLRHALESYYEGEGKADAITIVLPNRAASVRNGTPEKRWIVAKSRNSAELAAAENDKPRWRTNVRRRLKITAAIAAAGALGFVGYFATRVLAVHDQPKFARMDGSTLTIFSAEGKELWRKGFPDGFTSDWYYERGIATRIWFEDLEGQGHTDVLFLYLPAVSTQSHSSTLICYSDRGTETWRWTPGRALPELEGSPATFRTVAMKVLKAGEKRPSRIVVSSIHDTWWPSYIAMLDSNGKTVSEYWHSGALNYMVLADLDGDGREEIVATGISIGYHQATLVVLDPDRVVGASAEVARPDFQIHGMGVAQERLRLLFPRSDLNKALFTFNMALEPTIERGSTRLTVAECVVPPGCLVWYDLNKSLHLITAYAGDEFRSAHARFYQNGKDAHPFSAEEQAAFWRVRCLVGCKTEFLPGPAGAP